MEQEERNKNIYVAKHVKVIVDRPDRPSPVTLHDPGGTARLLCTAPTRPTTVVVRIGTWDVVFYKRWVRMMKDWTAVATTRPSSRLRSVPWIRMSSCLEEGRVEKSVRMTGDTVL